MNPEGLGVLRPRTVTRSVRRLAAGVFVTSLVAVGLSSQGPAPAATVQTKTVAAVAVAPDAYEKRVIRQVNKRRVNHGLRKVRFAACPDGTAESWSRYLAVNGEFFHQSMNHVLDACDAQYAGETLGRGSMGPGKLVGMWMHSPGHREILLSRKARRIGIGATPDTSGRWVVAANFIRF